MSLWELTITVDIDDDALAAHDGDEGPPPNRVKDWYSSDVLLACQKGILSFDDDEIGFAKKL